MLTYDKLEQILTHYAERAEEQTTEPADSTSGRR